MAYPSVTYSFTNGTTISATEVNQNFTDLINGLSDGTKDLNVSALTAAGTANLNGAVNLGNATSDDVTITGYVAATVNPKTANSFDLGGSSQTWRSGYFATSVLTPLIKAIDGNGIKFQENGGTEVMSISDAGAMTVGAGTTGTTFTSKGFTSLGDGNTAIKIKRLTGTTSGSEGGSAPVAHGLTGAKIVSLSCLVFYGTNSAICPEFSQSAGYQYSLGHGATNVSVDNHPTNSENILSKPFVVLVFYIE